MAPTHAFRLARTGLVFSLVVPAACASSPKDTATPAPVSTGIPDAASDAAPVPVPATAGVCFGKGTHCDAASIEDIVPGPGVTCAVTDGGAATVAWKADLGTVPCPSGTCPAMTADVAVASDGSVWAAVLLEPPGGNDLTAANVGRALMRFAPTGDRALATVTDFGTRLNDFGRVIAEGLGVDAAGHLLLAAPTADSIGLELREYDDQGNVRSTIPLVDRATFGSVAFASDGSVALAYLYADTTDAGADAGLTIGGPPARVGVARFDSSRQLLWNQTAFPRPSAGAQPLVVGSGPSEGATIRLRADGPDVGMSSLLVEHLDSTGNPSWVRRSANVGRARALSPADGTTLVLSETGDGTSLLLDKIDSAGGGVWRMDVPGYAGGGTSNLAAVDADGTIVVIQESGAPPDPTHVTTVSADGQRCTTFTLDVPYAVPQASGYTTDDVRLVSAGPGEFVYGTLAGVGRVKLGAP